MKVGGKGKPTDESVRAKTKPLTKAEKKVTTTYKTGEERPNR